MDGFRVLDLCCGAGGASQGYADGGAAAVLGCDTAEQPDYPFPFILGDAIDVAVKWAFTADLVSGSPPCQRDAAITKGTNAHLRETYPDVYTPLREALIASGRPYVIENPLARADLVLCGEMFGLGVIRHRRFELGGWSAEQPEHKPHRGPVRSWRHGKWTDGPYVAAYGNGGGKASVPEMQEAMRIPWTNVRRSLTEAIPPAYTQYIGEQFTKWRNG